MAERSTSVRLQVLDGGKVRAEMRAFGAEGEAALDRITAAAVPASRGLLALDAAASELRGRMDGLVGGLGPVGAALSRLGPAGIAAGLGIAAITVGIGKGLAEYAEAEQANLRLAAVLKATGMAAGLTADDIIAMGDEIEASTMQSAESAKAAAAVLATFKSVSGPTFREALGLAADLAAVFGGDMSSAATQLGKALEDPVEGMNALKRVGVTFTATQRDMVSAMVDAGRVAEAQRVVLDTLAAQVGGAAGAEAGGLSGAFKKARDEAGNFFEALASSTGVAAATKAALDGIADGLRNVNAAMSMPQLARVGKEIADVESQLATARRLFGAADPANTFNPVTALEAQLAALKRQEAALKSVADAKAADDRQSAERGKAAAKEVADEERLAKIRADNTKALEAQATQEEKIAAARKKAAETIANLETLRKPDGSNAAAIDKETARANEALRRQIEAISKADVKAGETATAKTREVIDDLITAANTYGDAREKFIAGAIDKLGAKASAADIAAVRAQAGKTFDAQSGAKITEANRTAAEQYAVTMRELTRDLDAGTIAQGTFERAAAKAAETLRTSTVTELQASASAVDNIRGALMSYAKEATDFSKNVGTAVSSIATATEDALVTALTTGQADVHALVQSILADLARLAVRQAITGPLFALLSGGLPVPTRHAGGMVDGGGGGRTIDPLAFLGAPRFHGGGMVGLRHDERPIIAQIGERIQSRDEVRRESQRQTGTVYNIDARGADLGTVARIQQTLAQHDRQFDAIGKASDRNRRGMRT